LLPKLIQLLSNEKLSLKVTEILSELLLRLKQFSCKLPYQDLLQLINPKNCIEVCDWSITFLDLTIDNPLLDNLRHIGFSTSLIELLPLFEVFSLQSNALCYYALNCALLTNSEISININNNCQNVLADYLLDILLVQKMLVNNAVGSIQPGLSSQRIDRLTLKKKNWNFQDLRKAKLSIINLISTNCLSSKYSTLLAVVVACDEDAEVSTQGTFKMNGAVDFFKIHEDAPDAVLSTMLSLCDLNQRNNETLNNNSSRQWSINNSRSTLRIEVQCCVLKWITKQMHQYVVLQAKLVSTVVFKLVFNAASTTNSIKVVLHAIKLGLLLIMKLEKSNHDFSMFSILFLQCAKKILSTSQLSAKSNGSNNNNNNNNNHNSDSIMASTATSNLSNTNANSEEELQVSCRIVCYEIIEHIANKNTELVTKDFELVMFLFKMLENDSDYRSLPKLYAAFEALRFAFKNKCFLFFILFCVRVAYVFV
jgi:hypothetical protein